MLVNRLERNKEQAASVFQLFAASLGLLLVVSSSTEVPIFIPNAVTTSHDKTPCNEIGWKMADGQLLFCTLQWHFSSYF